MGGGWSGGEFPLGTKNGSREDQIEILGMGPSFDPFRK